MQATHLRTGKHGENAAATFLQKAGYTLVARNWREKKRGSTELDIICLDGDTLVFVEVKTRRSGSMQTPCEALTAAKKRNIARAAQQYVTQTDGWEHPCRFDLIAVQQQGSSYEVEHYIHAFDLSEIMGGGHTAWQPW